MKLAMEDLGKPLGYLVEKYMDKKRTERFVYSDAWGAIVLRQEAWIKIGGLVDDVKSGRFILGIRDEIRSQQEKYHRFDEFDLCCTDMERFWEGLVFKIKKEMAGSEQT